MASGGGMPRLAASVRYPECSQCAENSPGSNPTICALLDDPVDGARFERSCRDIAPAIDFAKHTALVNVCRFKPVGKRFDGSAGQIDDLVLIGTAGFGATKMDAERGEGRAILIGDRGLFVQLFYAQAGHLAAPSPAGGKGYHQDGPVANRGQIIAGTGRQQLYEDIAGNSIRALAASRTVDGTDGKTDCRLDGRRRKRPLQSAPAGQCRPVGKTTTDRCRRMRSRHAQKALSAQFVFHTGRHAVTRFDLPLLWSPQMMGNEF